MGARLQVTNLTLELDDGRLQRRHLIAKERDLALQESDVGLGDRPEGGSHLRRQCLLLVHAKIPAPARPSAYPL